LKKKFNDKVPRYSDLINPVFSALKKLGGSGTNEEILEKVIESLSLSNEIVDFPHKNSSSITELSYQSAWARTYLKNYGVIQNSARSVWSINPAFTQVQNLDQKTIISELSRKSIEKKKTYKTKKTDVINIDDSNMQNDKNVEEPDEQNPWRRKLIEILQNMDPYGFERLSQRILRECGFSQVEVTRKSADGGIDGTGKLKINGIFSFNVAFQSKRYKELVGPAVIRDFRGSLTADIEKGVIITTGTFSKSARDEASNPGKMQIDLIDGEELLNKITEFGIGVREILTYEIDEDFFSKI
jgi:restriction system protein